MKDSSRLHRSFMKGISWETFSFFLTVLITFMYTGSVRTSIELTSICFGVKIIFFFLHERLWHQIRWGKRTDNV